MIRYSRGEVALTVLLVLQVCVLSFAEPAAGFRQRSRLRVLLGASRGRKSPVQYELVCSIIT
jgi:hypothetical protein